MILKMSVAVEFMEYSCWRISVQAPRVPKAVQAICGRETHPSEKPSGAVVVMTEGKKSGGWEEGQGGAAATRRAVVPLRKRDPLESWRAAPEWRRGSSTGVACGYHKSVPLGSPFMKELAFSCEMADSLQGQCLHRMSRLLSQDHTPP